MTPTSRLEAQQRADEIRIFEAELKRLQQDGVVTLTEEQRRAIAQHHATLLAQYAQAFDIDRDVKAKQLSLGMRIASFLGALALAQRVLSVLPILGAALYCSAGHCSGGRCTGIVLRNDVGAGQGCDRLFH